MKKGAWFSRFAALEIQCDIFGLIRDFRIRAVPEKLRTGDVSTPNRTHLKCFMARFEPLIQLGLTTFHWRLDYNGSLLKLDSDQVIVCDSTVRAQ